MAHLKQIANRAYISKTLKEKLLMLEQYHYSFICAPSGYGKSIVAKTFYKNYSGYMVLWIDGHSPKEQFWKSYCNAMKLVNPICAERFAQVGFPKSEEDVSSLVDIQQNALSKNSQTFLLVENFSDIADTYLYHLLTATYSNSFSFGMKLIFFVRKINDNYIRQLIGKNLIGFIGKEDLSFSSEDIIDYFRLNELNITEEQAKALYEYCAGWPFIVELQMNAFRNNNRFENDISINTFLGTNIWTQMSEELQDFMLRISVFYDFSIAQCAEHVDLKEQDCLNLIYQSGLFFYDKAGLVFRLNPLFRIYLRDILKEKSIDERLSILISAAATYINRGNYFYGIQLYVNADSYEAIYHTTPKLENIYKFIVKENKQLFLKIAEHYWDVDKNGHYDAAIIVCFAMFLYNEKILFQNLTTDIQNDISTDSSLMDKQRNKYLAEIQYVASFAGFNDFYKMNEGFQKVLEISKSPVDIIAGQFTFSFGCPSYLSLYHKKPGTLDQELSMIEDCAPNYYRLTNGHGKGFEALMRAEVLYNRCEINGAEILCHKASYMADTRDQRSIYIISNYLLAAISIYRGENDEYKEYLSNFLNKFSEDTAYSDQLKQMAEICHAMIFISLGDTERLADWLTDEKTMENSCNFISLSYVNIIYGKYLLLTEQYHHFLGISGHLLGISKIYSYIVPRIYTYIYLAIANDKIGETQKAHRFMVEALELAIQDKLYMPFVSNYDLIDHIIEKISANKTFAFFIKNIMKYSRVYTKGLKIIQKSGRQLANFGLTAREAEVARLAAQRLTNKEIADTLFIAESTVKSNMKVIFNKLSIRSRSDLKNFFEA